MRPTLADAVGHELVWVQPAVGRPEYELRADNKVIASLSGTRGQCMGQSWTFKPEGWFRRRMTVNDPVSNLDMAVFRWSRREAGVLELLDGRTLHFDSSPIGYDWLESDGALLVHFQPRAGFDLGKSSIEIEQAAAHLTELPLLVVLGQYLATLYDARRSELPNAWSIWDWIDWPWLPELPDIQGLPDIDW